MLVEEGVGEKTVQRYSPPMVDCETASYEVPGSRGEGELGRPNQLARADLLVCGVGDSIRLPSMSCLTFHTGAVDTLLKQNNVSVCYGYDVIYFSAFTPRSVTP